MKYELTCSYLTSGNVLIATIAVLMAFAFVSAFV